MSEFPDELGWIEFPGSERAAWATSCPPSAGGAPAPDGARGAVPRRAFKRGLVFTRGRREGARREATAEWRRERMAAIRERSLKSGVITVGSGFGGTGKTDVAVTLAAIYAAARPADRVIFADTNDVMPHGYSRLGARRSRRCRGTGGRFRSWAFITLAWKAASGSTLICAMQLHGCREWL